MRSSSRWRDRAELIPDPLISDVEHARFYHTDLAERSTSEIWAEVTVLETWLANHVFRRVRPRLIDAVDWVTDIQWVRGRVRRLRAMLAQRLKGAA